MEELSKYISTNKNKSVKSSLKRNQNVRADTFGLKKKQKPSSTYDLNHDQNSYKLMKGRDLLKEKKKNDLQKLLPVNHCREQIVDAFKKSETLLLMGETGSGKTTQIPQFLLDEGLAKRGLIGVTQPRRIAAISVAKRVSQELGSSLGETVGYKVRFEDCTSSSTKIKFLTDGTLLREALRDRLLLDYKVIILDEAHERSISTDVLFGILKTAQALRKGKGLENLKLIIQSATMDIDNFSCYFGVPGMYLEGRMHPIRVMHTKEHQVDYLNSALVTLFNVHRSSPINEDVLIFLTGQEEIEMFAQRIRQILKAHSDLPGISVCPLYAQLPQHKQMECFQPSLKNFRKVVLATNIAETSITIPGIRCVIDCGFVKRRMFNISNGLEILRKVRISQAEAWQRCGRAGRDAPGRCFRTYTTKEMNFFDSMTEPELLRSNICTAVLSLLALGIDCRTFDFLDAPSPAAIKSAYHSLYSLGAIKTEINPSLTNVGLQMAQFPLDPRFSKIIINANSLGCLEQILSIISMLSSENVFISSPGTREKAALVHAKFLSKDGDLLTLLNLYNSSQKVDNIKTWCHENFINTRNLLYAREVRRQLVEICKRMNLKVNSSEPKYDEIKKCLLTGYFENIAELQQDNTYLTISTRQRAKVHPSSVYQKFCKPKYIIYNEIVLTDRFYLCQLTEISKEWVSDIVPSFK